MTSIAGHIRIFDHEPTDDLVLKRTVAIAELSKTYREGKSVADILRMANDIAFAVQPQGAFSTQQGAMIETAIRKSSEAFIAEGHELEMLVCDMLGALGSLDGDVSASGKTTSTDIFSLGLWSALSFQKKRTEAKLEALRAELMDAAHAHCMKSASRSRDRYAVADPAFKAPETLDAAGVEKGLEPFQKAIANLRANAAVDREELDLLWWIMSDRSTLLGRRLSTEKNVASAAAASGIEASLLLRRMPATAHCHLALRNVSKGNSMTLPELVAMIGDDREALFSPFKGDSNVSTCPTIFPFLRALQTGATSDANAKVKRTLEDWSARALLESAISHLGSHLPSVVV